MNYHASSKIVKSEDNAFNWRKPENKTPEELEQERQRTYVREYAARKRAAERVNTAQFFASRETEADSVKLAKLIGRPLNSRGR
ncbi:hypothetical protein [Rhodoferax aquaticus]|jgi:hypothetical protein|uniref:Uncharacterized protein n=1 Tax=Rhodoferax aquaticus TaxID=2527691 RepID=A0A515ESQ2_9BURK|nr:hypothetical protein [Rhodoferax aquaticus]QDL55643.1 hypothetical protein EXZ61_16490 [Rhodoferax aquaticus]